MKVEELGERTRNDIPRSALRYEGSGSLDERVAYVVPGCFVGIVVNSEGEVWVLAGLDECEGWALVGRPWFDFLVVRKGGRGNTKRSQRVVF